MNPWSLRCSKLALATVDIHGAVLDCDLWTRRGINFCYCTSHNFIDTLADLKEFSGAEKDQIKCLLDRRGYRAANDELLNVVQRRPRDFARLVASVKTKHNDDLLKKIWDYVSKFYRGINRQDLLDKLERCIDEIAQKHIPEPVQYRGDGGDRGASAIGPGPQRLMLDCPDATQAGSPVGRGGSPGILYLRTDSAYSSQSQERSHDDLAQQDQAEALGKLTPEATPVKSPDSFVGVREDVFQPVSSPATPDQNNFAGMELMKVRAGILRAVGKEIGTAWQEVCGCLDLDITMEDEIEMEDKIEKSPLPGYKFLQLIGVKILPSNERITVQQLSDALLESNQVVANDILLGKKDRRAGSLHQSFSEVNINQRQGTSGEAGRGDNQQLNIEPFRSLPADTNNMDSQGADQKRSNGTKTLNFPSPRSSENVDESARPNSLESSDSNLSGIQSPNNTGNIPLVVNDPSILKATGSYYPSLEGPGDRDNIQNLKEYIGMPPTDQGLKNTAFNPDVERRKLQDDTELQSTAIGHGPNSHGYQDLCAREQPRGTTVTASPGDTNQRTGSQSENSPTAADVGSLEYSFSSRFRFDTPDLGVNVPRREEESLPIPRGNIPSTVSNQQCQDGISASRGDNLPQLTRQQDEGQDKVQPIENEDNSTEVQEQNETCESIGEGQTSDVSIETDNDATEVIDTLNDLKTDSILSEGS